MEGYPLAESETWPGLTKAAQVSRVWESRKLELHTFVCSGPVFPECSRTLSVECSPVYIQGEHEARARARLVLGNTGQKP